jgi:hypothetical protein
LLIPVIGIVLYLSNTTSAFIPAVLGTIFFFFPYILKENRMFVFGGGGLIVCLSYACFQHSAIWSNPRWVDWAAALKQLTVHPLVIIFGMGPGAGWGKVYPMHNEWLQGLHQFGLIGLTFMAGYVITIYRCNRILFTAFMIAVVNMFGNYSLHLSPSAFLIIVIAGLIERERRISSGPDSTWAGGI